MDDLGAIERLESDLDAEQEIHGPEFMADLRAVLALAREALRLRAALTEATRIGGRGIRGGR